MGIVSKKLLWENNWSIKIIDYFLQNYFSFNFLQVDFILKFDLLRILKIWNWNIFWQCFMNEWMNYIERTRMFNLIPQKVVVYTKMQFIYFQEKIFDIKTVVLKLFYFLILIPELRSRTSFLPLFSGFRLFLDIFGGCFGLHNFLSTWIFICYQHHFRKKNLNICFLLFE